MGSVGDAYDNAMAESFFSTLEAELLSRRRFASQAEAKMACFTYIADLANFQAIATTMFCPRRLAAARETKAVEIKLVTSNGRVVTIVVAGECGLSLVYSER
jgi:hypothetical protein